jgi:hypothetical protein
LGEFAVKMSQLYIFEVQHFELLGRVDWLIFKAPIPYRQDDWLD